MAAVVTGSYLLYNGGITTGKCGGALGLKGLTK